jgi:hypothetical protein
LESNAPTNVVAPVLVLGTKRALLHTRIRKRSCAVQQAVYVILGRRRASTTITFLVMHRQVHHLRQGGAVLSHMNLIIAISQTSRRVRRNCQPARSTPAPGSPTQKMNDPVMALDTNRREQEVQFGRLTLNESYRRVAHDVISIGGALGPAT